MSSKHIKNSALINISSQPCSAPGCRQAVDYFSALADLPWAIWLDSCYQQGSDNHPDSRYDILLWQPELTLTTDGDNTRVNDARSGRLIECSNADPLALLKRYQQQLFADYNIADNALPFNGGAAGYFAYDLGRRFERLPSQAERDIKLPEMAVGIYCQALIYDNAKQQMYLLCPDDQRAQISEWLNARIKMQHQAKVAFALTGPWQANMSHDDYQHKFNQVQQYLLSGDCYQINLAQRFSTGYQGDEFSAYLALRSANKAPFSAFMRFDNASILSISPERFLQLQHGQVQSKPIKGTMPRSTDAGQDQHNADTLRHSSKDRAENLMIVDLLRNDISKVCEPGSVQVPELFAIESFPAVHHLVSTVTGTLAPEHDACDLLRAAFPGGSITGAPKIRAMEIIEQLEPHRRSVYCGSIGYISACGNMDTSITIRTLVAANNRIHCWAGGGLVADSTVDSEYQETYDKVNRILPVLSKL